MSPLDSKIRCMNKSLPPSRTADQYVVRFPDGMRDRIAEAAKANGRSMNAEIIARLQSTFTPTQQRLDFQAREELLTLVNEAIDERIARDAQAPKRGGKK